MWSSLEDPLNQGCIEVFLDKAGRRASPWIQQILSSVRQKRRTLVAVLHSWWFEMLLTIIFMRVIAKAVVWIAAEYPGPFSDRGIPGLALGSANHAR
jgi:hypothetical protein